MTTSKSAAARHLSPKRLHPRLGEAWRSFKHEDYGAAVFLAMKAVEVAVRDAAGMSPSDLGMSLMRKAFDVFGGPLSDYSAESAERQGPQRPFRRSYRLLQESLIRIETYCSTIRLR
ncbi:TIGR02391 family protein [Bradyrhizobium sp. CCBAU 21359]|uniref:TIGR02391 family protein n=1 Tax=Bradyrhizobium sp. CCBAU 21359 TaxID=1325080 RepID=UPI002305481C|nr:TIGR02391 family protein [Bradyrhizobium sp. CCBAU 21359]